MKNLLSAAAFLVQTLVLSPGMQAQTLQTIDEIFEPGQSLCGKPDFAASNQEEGLVILNIENGSVAILFDEETAEEAFSFMRHDSYLNMCVPVEDETLVRPGQTITAEWFACWSPAGAGISVSNQRTTTGGMPPLVPGVKPLVPGVKPLIPGGKPLIPSVKPLVGGARPIVGDSMPVGGGVMPIFKNSNSAE